MKLEKKVNVTIRYILRLIFENNWKKVNVTIRYILRLIFENNCWSTEIIKEQYRTRSDRWVFFVNWKINK